jgi:hypothetical protein
VSEGVVVGLGLWGKQLTVLCRGERGGEGVEEVNICSHGKILEDPTATQLQKLGKTQYPAFHLQLHGQCHFS